MKKTTPNIVIISFFVFIFCISSSLVSLLINPKESNSTELSLISPDTFSETAETYFSENIFCKRFMRFLKANVAYNILFQTENNGLIIKDGNITKTEEFKEDVLRRSLEIFRKISEDFHEKKIIAILPGKNEYFFSNETFFHFYNNTRDEVKNEFRSEFTVIDSKDDFNISSFFNTDHHIKQPAMLLLKKRIAKELQSKSDVEEPIRFTTITDSFVGVLGDQSAIPIRKDKLEYYESSIINHAAVKIYDDGIFKDGKVYCDEFKNEYNFFFGGNKAIIKISNDIDANKSSDKRLVIFRDSYASALAPLLIEDFSEIILIDLRIIDYEKAIDIVGTDGNVLLLYGTQSVCCDGISR